MLDREDIVNLIINTIKELVDEGMLKGIENPNLKTRLYGSNSDLDSLNLVILISEVEERASDFLDIDLLLADERAMSMTRSPFRRVETLADYIHVLAQEKIAP
tara:strand:- start:391 stop:699 length:309 start_codon:yes stop_codon:yes gene_type:complete